MILHLVEQHASTAGFLWHRRDAAVCAYHYTLETLSDLDERLEAHLDGLRVAGEAGVSAAREALVEDEQGGGLFVAAVLAAERRDLTSLAALLDAAAEDAARMRELVSALGWLSWEAIEPLLPGFLAPGGPPLLRRIGLAACGAHRRDPGAALHHALYADDPGLRARALRLAGELRRADLRGAVQAETGSSDASCQLWARWSCVLLGDVSVAEGLWPFVEAEGPHRARALEVAASVLPPRIALEWLDALLEQPDGGRLSCIGATAMAEASALSWLAELLHEPDLARIAAEGISAIAGVAIAGPLAAGPPEGFAPGPSDDPERDDVAMDPDEHLPWPNVAALEARVRVLSATMPRGLRLAAGKPAAPDVLQRVLRAGTQPRRAGAAIDLALHQNRGGPLFEVRAPARRQRALLGA